MKFATVFFFVSVKDEDVIMMIYHGSIRFAMTMTTRNNTLVLLDHFSRLVDLGEKLR